LTIDWKIIPFIVNLENMIVLDNNSDDLRNIENFTLVGCSARPSCFTNKGHTLENVILIHNHIVDVLIPLDVDSLLLAFDGDQHIFFQA
jgi:hypothetical protein